MVRNFWIDASIDGRKTKVAGGPRAKDGGIDITIYQRNSNASQTSIKITGIALSDGVLLLEIKDKDGNIIHEIETVR